MPAPSGPNTPRISPRPTPTSIGPKATPLRSDLGQRQFSSAAERRRRYDHRAVRFPIIALRLAISYTASNRADYGCMIEPRARGVEDLAAVAKDDHPITNREDFLNTMRDEDHAGPAARQLAHALKEVADLVYAEGGGRLVEDEDAAAPHDRAGHLHSSVSATPPDSPSPRSVSAETPSRLSAEWAR